MTIILYPKTPPLYTPLSQIVIACGFQVLVIFKLLCFSEKKHYLTVTREPARKNRLRQILTKRVTETSTRSDPIASVQSDTETATAPGTVSAFPITPETRASNKGTSPVTPQSGSQGSGKGDALIRYIHNVSPIKRNKRDTVDYSTFTLQVAENKAHKALCYSTSKRAILAEKETPRTPVKLMRYAKTSDKEKLVVNDITHITVPNTLECNFQFWGSLNDQSNVTLDQLDQAPEDKLTVVCKVLKRDDTKTVEQGKYNVANATVADSTAKIILDVWNDRIP